MKPRICIVSFSAYPLFNTNIQVNHGGAEVESANIAKALSQRGLIVDVVVGDYGQAATECYDQVRVWRGVKVEPSSLVQGLRNTLALWILWKKINADIYFTKGAGFLPFQLALFCVFFRKKFVFKTSHKKNIDLSLKEKPYHPFYQWALHHAARVFVQNAEDVALMKKNYGIEASVLKNYHFIPDTETKNLVERKYLLWVGRIAQIKRPEIFLEIAEKMPTVSCVMVYFLSDTALGEHLKKRASQLSNLQLHENVPHDKVDIFYQNAKLFVSTSDAEGFPNTFIEALKYGTPIASLNVNPDHFLEHARVGFCADNQLSHLCDGIQELLSDPSRWSEYSHNAKGYAKNEFGEKIIHEWEYIFKHLL